jgi:glyoxylase-like metal-dependent hydrolase (beta-lactamase superfamily II)
LHPDIWSCGIIAAERELGSSLKLNLEPNFFLRDKENKFNDCEIEVRKTPGHTRGHVYFACHL